MNKKIGAAGALVDLLAVLGFAVCMLLDFDSGSYFCSMFIAVGFVIMMCGFLCRADGRAKGQTLQMAAGAADDPRRVLY